MAPVPPGSATGYTPGNLVESRIAAVLEFQYIFGFDIESYGGGRLNNILPPGGRDEVAPLADTVCP